jgi:HK97 family phage major capsid protein
LIAVPYGLSGQYRQNGAVWAMAKGSVAETRGLSDGMSRPLWTDNNNALAAGQPERLLGYPVKESEALGAVTANYYPIIFGDFKGYRIVDRIGMTIERYLDSTTAATDTVRYFMRWRGGGKVTDGWRFVVVKVSAA